MKTTMIRGIKIYTIFVYDSSRYHQSFRWEQWQRTQNTPALTVPHISMAHPPHARLGVQLG